MRSLLALPLLCACQEDWCARFDLDCPDGVVEALDTTDRDGDGWIAPFDCVDNDEAINPQASELCNGVDDDCDGVVDEDLPRYRTVVDVDGDGYGVEDGGEDCVPQGVAVPKGGDCDETDPDISPGAKERCDGIDNNCDGLTDAGLESGGVESWRDDDGDTYGQEAASILVCPDVPGWTDRARPVDCDDTNPEIYPQHDELCNGIDDDCDHQVDSDDTIDMRESSGGYRLYLDSDGDGYGVSIGEYYRCEVMEGYTTLDGDCDDLDPAQHPGVVERCDGVDNNCDGLTDDGADLDGSLPQWWQDADGDGYGDPAAARRFCEVPGGWTDNGQDCDDADPNTFPGSIAERCDEIVDRNCDGETGVGDFDGDGVIACLDCDDTNPSVSPLGQEVCDPAQVDEDCDGVADDEDPTATALFPFYVDLDGDGHGSTTVVWACDPGGGRASLDDDCDDTAPETFPGATERCGDDLDQDCAGDTDLCSWRGTQSSLTATSYSHSAAALTGAVIIAADLTEGGGPTLIVGAPPVVSGGSRVYLHSGLAGGASVVPAEAEASVVDLTFSGSYGSALAGGLDLTGDGLPDLAVGAKGRGYGGEVTVLDGPFSGLRDDADAVLLLTSPLASQDLGNAILTMEGEGGVSWLWAGTPGNRSTQAGYVYGVQMPLAGTYDISRVASVSLVDDGAMGLLAQELADAGDVDGDGLHELLIATALRADRYDAFLFYGPVAGIEVRDADLLFVAGGTGTAYGASLGTGRDVDGDGRSDLVLGASASVVTTGSTGSAAVFLGDSLEGKEGDIAWELADALYLGGPGEYLGAAVGVVADPTDPARLGVAMGASTALSTTGGRVYWEEFTAGTHFPTNVVLEGQAGEFLGYPLTVGDLDADGLEDVAVQAHGRSDLFYLRWAGD